MHLQLAMQVWDKNNRYASCHYTVVGATPLRCTWAVMSCLLCRTHI